MRVGQPDAVNRIAQGTRHNETTAAPRRETRRGAPKRTTKATTAKRPRRPRGGTASLQHSTLAGTIPHDGGTLLVTSVARRRPPRRWSRVRPAAPLDPDRRQAAGTLPAVRLRAPRLPLRPGAVAPSAPARRNSPAIASNSPPPGSSESHVPGRGVGYPDPGRGARAPPALSLQPSHRAHGVVAVRPSGDSGGVPVYFCVMPEWLPILGAVTGTIGAISGLVGAILGYKGYRRAHDGKALDLRLELRKAESDVRAIVEELPDLMERANVSHRHVLAATGLARSGAMTAWIQDWNVHREALRLLKQEVLARSDNAHADGTNHAQLESRLVSVHTLTTKAKQLQTKYEDELRKDDGERILAKVIAAVEFNDNNSPVPWNPDTLVNPSSESALDLQISRQLFYS